MKLYMPFLMVCIMFSTTCFSSDNSEIHTGVKKWHPGHYILLYPGQKSPAYLNSVVRELRENPAFLGVQKKYLWKDLEPLYGVYDFSEIREDLASLGAINKQLVLTVQAESFLHGEVRVPSYLLNEAYEGGVYSINSGQGLNVAYYNANVQARMVALVQALGKEFDKSVNLEAVNFEETSPSRQEPEWHRAYFKKYISGMLRVAIEAKKAFPNTVVIQYVNYPETALPMIIQTLKDNQLGVGGPDVYENNPYLAKGIYSYYPQIAGLVPIGMSVDYHNYQSSFGMSGPIDNPSIESIHQFAMKKLKPNYMFWLRRTSSPSNKVEYWKSVLDYMKKYDGKNDVAGGLRTECPLVISPCMQN